MSQLRSLLIATLLLRALEGGSAVHAADRAGNPQAPRGAQGEAAARGLSAAQIQRVRAVSRQVLAAKKSGSDEGDDSAELNRLRATLDQLLAAEFDPENRVPITLQGQETSAQRSAQERAGSLREAARTDARALAAQLRSRAEVKAARARSAPEADTRSAGLPVGEQRARLFARWASKLDAALAEGNTERAMQFIALREQLRPTGGGVSEVAPAHATPMLQAMPGDDAAPIPTEPDADPVR